MEALVRMEGADVAIDILDTSPHLADWHIGVALRGGAPARDFDDAFFDNLLVEQLNLTPVPEPTTLAMLALGVAGVGLVARRRRS